MITIFLKTRKQWDLNWSATQKPLPLIKINISVNKTLCIQSNLKSQQCFTDETSLKVHLTKQQMVLVRLKNNIFILKKSFLIRHMIDWCAGFRFLSALLLGHTNSAALSPGGFGVLTAHAQAPVVTQPAMQTNLLHALKVLAVLTLEIGGQNL